MIELFPTREIMLIIGPLELHWYGMMYFIAFLCGIFITERVMKYRDMHLSRKQIDSLLTYMVLGVVVGGRLGYVILWNPSYFLDNPFDIVAAWKGGMSSHGGMIGAFLCAWLFCRRNNVSVPKLGDVLVISIAFGLGLGRIGNFINQELYGIPTTLPWAIDIPGVPEPRHPTQIYALIKNWTLCLILYLHLRGTRQHYIAGRTFGLFFLLYGIFRFIVEIFREQPEGYYDLGILQLSHGQVLTIPVIILGIVIILLCGGLIARKRM